MEAHSAWNNRYTVKATVEEQGNEVRILYTFLTSAGAPKVTTMLMTKAEALALGNLLLSATKRPEPAWRRVGTV